MNLELTRQLLTAADGHRTQSPFQVTGRDATREVELLADAGFVEGTADHVTGKPTAVIVRLTGTGKKLLRVLTSQILP